MTTAFPMTPYCPPPPEALGIVYEDAHLIVAGKPSGLLSVPGRGPEKAVCAQSILSDRFGEVFTVHRLDMDTSGAIVFARSKPAQSRLARAFQDRAVSKTYLAWVAGHPTPPKGRIDRPIAAYSLQRPLRHIAEDGQRAITDYETLSQRDGSSLVRLTPLTGRSHQLRLHLQSIGTPILGDRFYGSGDTAPHLLLHASSLTFPHPDSGAASTHIAPLPDYF